MESLTIDTQFVEQENYDKMGEDIMKSPDRMKRIEMLESPIKPDKKLKKMLMDTEKEVLWKAPKLIMSGEATMFTPKKESINKVQKMSSRLLTPSKLQIDETPLQDVAIHFSQKKKDHPKEEESHTIHMSLDHSRDLSMDEPKKEEKTLTLLNYLMVPWKLAYSCIQTRKSHYDRVNEKRDEENDDISTQTNIDEHIVPKAFFMEANPHLMISEHDLSMTESERHMIDDYRYEELRRQMMQLDVNLETLKSQQTTPQVVDVDAIKEQLREELTEQLLTRDEAMQMEQQVNDATMKKVEKGMAKMASRLADVEQFMETMQRSIQRSNGRTDAIVEKMNHTTNDQHSREERLQTIERTLITLERQLIKMQTKQYEPPQTPPSAHPVDTPPQSIGNTSTRLNTSVESPPAAPARRRSQSFQSSKKKSNKVASRYMNATIAASAAAGVSVDSFKRKQSELASTVSDLKKELHRVKRAVKVFRKETKETQDTMQKSIKQLDTLEGKVSILASRVPKKQRRRSQSLIMTPGQLDDSMEAEDVDVVYY